MKGLAKGIHSIQHLRGVIIDLQNPELAGCVL